MHAFFVDVQYNIWYYTHMKQCMDCKTIKDDSEFNVKHYKSGAVGLRSYCKECGHKQRQDWRRRSPKDNARNKQYNKNHAQEIRGKKLLKYWPLVTWQTAINEWNALFERQNGVCAICKKAKRLLHVDHCHSSGKVRGLLCYNCNNGLGRFKDSVVNLKEAIIYLSK